MTGIRVWDGEANVILEVYNSPEALNQSHLTYILGNAVYQKQFVGSHPIAQPYARGYMMCLSRLRMAMFLTFPRPVAIRVRPQRIPPHKHSQ